MGNCWAKSSMFTRFFLPSKLLFSRLRQSCVPNIKFLGYAVNMYHLLTQCPNEEGLPMYRDGAKGVAKRIRKKLNGKTSWYIGLSIFKGLNQCNISKFKDPILFIQ